MFGPLFAIQSKLVMVGNKARSSRPRDEICQFHEPRSELQCRVDREGATMTRELYHSSRVASARCGEMGASYAPVRVEFM